MYDGSDDAGKSFMSDYLQTHHKAFIATGGKVADIVHTYEEQPVI
jgi:hypothetical protein